MTHILMHFSNDSDLAAAILFQMNIMWQSCRDYVVLNVEQ